MTNNETHPILHRGTVDGYKSDRQLEQAAADLEGVTVCRLFSTTQSGYLLFLTTDPNATPPNVDGVIWEQLTDAPNSLGQQGVK